MRKFAIAALMFGSLLLPAVAADAPAAGAKTPAVIRKVLMQEDVAGGQVMSLVKVTIPVGGREGSHTHPGPLIVHVISGAFSLDYEGKPNITYKPGETFFVDTNKAHEGINRGKVPAVAIAAFLIPKGQPMTVQMK